MFCSDTDISSILEGIECLQLLIYCHRILVHMISGKSKRLAPRRIFAELGCFFVPLPLNLFSGGIDRMIHALHRILAEIYVIIHRFFEKKCVLDYRCRNWCVFLNRGKMLVLVLDFPLSSDCKEELKPGNHFCSFL